MKNKLRIKVCGMKHQVNIADVDGLGVDYMGFIFYPKSKRDAEEVNPADIKHINAKKVGVFVNEPLYDILKKVVKYKLDAVQLHGDELPEECDYLKKLGLEVFKVFSVGDDFDFDRLEAYKETVDYFLFDTKGKERGGNGYVFDWEILKNYNLDIPLILSGGLNPENFADALKLENLNLYALDLNSGFETEPGLKDVDKLKTVLS